MITDFPDYPSKSFYKAAPKYVQVKRLKHLYIPLDKFEVLEMETNRIWKANESPVRYARFRNTAEVWYPPAGE